MNIIWRLHGNRQEVVPEVYKPCMQLNALRKEKLIVLGKVYWRNKGNNPMVKLHYCIIITVAKYNFIPGPSKGCQMVPEGCQFIIGLGLNWHPLEGVGIKNLDKFTNMFFSPVSLFRNHTIFPTTNREQHFPPKQSFIQIRVDAPAQNLWKAGNISKKRLITMVCKSPK